jgi:Tfp pilus assembly protein PilF
MSQAESMLPFYQFEWSPLLSIRIGNFKYIDAPKPELYDIAVDPGEKRNLYAGKQAMATRMKELLRQDIARYSPKNAAANLRKDVDPATAEKLASLGYLALSKGSSGPAPGKNLPDPKDRIEVYNLISDGTLAARNAKYDLAVRLLTEAVQSEPGSFVAHFQLGVVYRVTGALDRAEQEMQQALELRPGYDLALRRLAEIYMAGRRYDEAEATYKKVLAQHPNDYLAYFNLGGLYVTVDRWEEALAAFRKAQGLSGQDVLIPMVIARILLKKGDLAGALEAVQQALKLDPNLAAGHETAIEIYQKQGRIGDAEREAQILQRLKSKP